MKRCIVSAAVAAAAFFAMADGGSYQPHVATTYPYDVRPSAIVPAWSGAEPGVWTMDYAAAFGNAQSQNRYTLLLFSGMWWCPHCQALEENVLTKGEFADYVAGKGFYLAVVDNPYRNGVSNWCWLWDQDYRATTGLSEEEVAQEMVARFGFQDSWSKNGQYTVNSNVVCVAGAGVTNLWMCGEGTDYSGIPATTGYRRVGYPTIIVVAPDGTEAGRFSYNRSTPAKEALDLVIGNIELALAGAEMSDDPGKGGFLGKEAQTYVGWLKDGSGALAGTFKLKAGKANKKTGLSKLSATISLGVVSPRKISLSGQAQAPATNKVYVLEKSGVRARAYARLGANGFAGMLTVDGVEYSMDGARDVFSAKDAQAKAIASAVPAGFWTLAMEADGDEAFARGYGTLSVAFGSKGKVKVSGTLADGTKVNVSSQAVVGESGVTVVPVVSTMYSKKGGFALLLEFSDGKMHYPKACSPWKAAGKKWNFSVEWYDMKFSPYPGAGDPVLGFLSVEDFPAQVQGLHVTPPGPDGDMVTVSKNKWYGTKDVSDLKLAYTPKDGRFKGSMAVAATDAKGKAVKIKATVSGAVVGGKPYGTVFIKDVGSWRLAITSECGGDC